MTIFRLFFDDEGEVTRRQWWIATLVLVVLQMCIEVLASRLMPGGSRSISLFLSIAILIPFYSVNAKRFRAIGRSPSLALIGGALTAASILVDTFMPVAALNMLVGFALLGVIIWYVIDLGVLAHDDLPRRMKIRSVGSRFSPSR
jgi:uncharacterized membrane protein YhaH (DUF805 family)